MTIKEIWEMGPQHFNEWRRDNDLKQLFARFMQNLPSFIEWLDDQKLTIDFILSTDQPGQFFYWDKDVYVIKHAEGHLPTHFFVPVEDPEHEKQILRNHQTNKSWQQKFIPYLKWAKGKLGKEKVLPGDNYDFRIFASSDVPETSRSTITCGGQLLKMGGTKLEGWGQLNNYNLDFTDLDFLEIEGDFSMNNGVSIFYAGCRNWVIKNAYCNFTDFYHCHFENLSIHNSELYWVKFYTCEIFKANFENSRLRNIMIEDTDLNFFSFNRVEPENISYTPPPLVYHTGLPDFCDTVVDNCKRFRILFQNTGLRKESSEMYYMERLYEMKQRWHSSKLWETLSKICERRIKITLKHAGYYLWLLLHALSDLLSFCIWGFSVKPRRTLAFSLGVIVTYTILYYFSSIQSIHHDFVNSLYTSVIMFTTLGFGDFAPFSVGSYKLVLASEALLGAFTFGLFVSGYANKEKY